MYHRIIVPLDGTAFSAYAVPYAVRIAERSGASVELCRVHVHHDRNPDFAALTPYQFQHCVDAEYDYDAELAAQEQAALEELAECVRGQTQSSVTTRMLAGHIDDAIRHEAERAVADLVVMTTHARTGFARVRLGSVADRLVHSLSMPILLLQPGDATEPPPFDGFRRALVTLDGSPFSEQVLQHATPLLRSTGATPVLLHVVSPLLGPVRRTHIEPDGRVIQRQADARQYLMVQASTLAGHALMPEIQTVVHRNAAAAILDAAQASDIDVIVMATHGRGGLTRVLMGSVADEVLRHTRKPVLLFRPHPVGTPHQELQNAFMVYGQ